MRLFFCLAIGLALLSGYAPIAHAEYRAFWIEVKSPDGTQKKMVKSTLDPFQYVGYYPIPEGYSALYTETWMCRGRTNGQSICPSPKELEGQRQPASESSPTN